MASSCVNLGRRRLCGLWLLALPAGAALAGWPARAADGNGILELRVERSSEAGMYLTAHWSLVLPPLVESALLQGIAMHFVVEAQVRQPRWFWSDKVVAQAVRHLRLSYQPLTRRWRLVQSSTAQEDASGLGMALGQGFDGLEEALGALQRAAGWKIADADDLDPAEAYLVELQVRLDTSQLPRPLQFGAVGRPAWKLALSRTVTVPPEPLP